MAISRAFSATARACLIRDLAGLRAFRTGQDAKPRFRLIPREGRTDAVLHLKFDMETNMKLTFAKLIALGIIAVPGAALAADYVAADGNGDGMLSLEEVQAILPEISTDTFIAVDADGDGLLNQDELAVAQTEGLMPASDG